MQPLKENISQRDETRQPKALPWFRMYVDFLNDPKMVALAFEDQRHFIGVLALKAAGVLDDGCDPILLDRIVAQRLWIDHAVIRDVKRRLVASGLILDDWQPVAWERRQYVSDSSTERSRACRERKRATQVQRCNGVAATPPDTDTDTDTESEGKQKRSRSHARPSEPLTLPPQVSPEAWAKWSAYRSSKSRKGWTPEAQALSVRTLVSLVNAGHPAIKVIEQSIECGWTGLFALRGEYAHGGRQQVNKQEALEARNRAVAKQWLAEQAEKEGNHATA